MPCRIDECLSVESPAGFSAGQLFLVNQDRCLAFCFAAAAWADDEVAHIVAVSKGGVVAVECAEELSEFLLGSSYLADGQAVVDIDLGAVAVADDAAEGAAAGILVVVDDFAVEEAVVNLDDVVGIAVGIAHHAAVVAATASIVAVECAGVGAVLDGGLPVSIVDHCSAQDACLSAASACVVDVHVAVDVADCWIGVAGVCCHAACILESDVVRSVDVEVLDDAV